MPPGHHTAKPTSFAVALVAGAVAGMSVDIALFPIDTLKTRLQAPGGFLHAGGFRGIYNGLGAAALGSAPGAAFFFVTYELMKPITLQHLEQLDTLKAPEPLSHMLAASIGEVAACLVRVPTEVVKAKMQTAKHTPTLWATVEAVLREKPHGTGGLGSTGSRMSTNWITPLTGGLYRGYGITLFREIPFAMIQFPLYEAMKQMWARQQEDSQVGAMVAAACGSFSGAVAGGLTTPLDVLKTRLMLGMDKDGIPYRNVADVFKRTIEQEGRAALWKGIEPRVMWISIGGFVFFGAYEGSKQLLTALLT